MSHLFTIKARVPTKNGVRNDLYQADYVCVDESFGTNGDDPSDLGGVSVTFVANGMEHHYVCGGYKTPHPLSNFASRIIIENANGQTTERYVTNDVPKEPVPG